jgi:hypothetical protein
VARHVQHDVVVRSQQSVRALVHQRVRRVAPAVGLCGVTRSGEQGVSWTTPEAMGRTSLVRSCVWV